MKTLEEILKEALTAVDDSYGSPNVSQLTKYLQISGVTVDIDKAPQLHIWIDVDETEKLLIENSALNIIPYYKDTKEALSNNINVVHTSQLVFLSFAYNRRLFVHCGGEQHEIVLGECAGTKKSIKVEDNLLEMLLTGGFSWYKPR